MLNSWKSYYNKKNANISKKKTFIYLLLIIYYNLITEKHYQLEVKKVN
jgi:hypothetical protein